MEEAQCQGNETRSRSHEEENDPVFKLKVTVLRIKIKIKVAQQGDMKYTKEPRGWDSRSVHTVWQQLRQRCHYQFDSTDVRQVIVLMYVAAATAAQNGVRTHLLAAPLPQSHQCEQVH